MGLKRRRGVGVTLGLALIVMLFLAILCAGVFGRAASWWEDDAGLGFGECTVPGQRRMRFSYVVSPDTTKIYNLFVKGEYHPGGEDENFACGVSVDINLASASADVWSDSVFIPKQ